MQRNELLGDGKRSSLWDDDEDDAMLDVARPSGSNNRHSVQDLRRQQTSILENQNEGLEALAKVLSRQKHLALRIGDEVDEQNGEFLSRSIFLDWLVPRPVHQILSDIQFADILDDLAVTMENTDSRVGNETRGVNFAIQNESTRSYWVIIISLFAAIVIVSLL